LAKASEIAAELRKLAESFDSISDSIDIPYLYVATHHYEKDSFLAVARAMPRPVKKGETNYSIPEINLRYKSNAIDFYVSIPKSLTCEIVEPAKPAVYKCDPILSQLEVENV
jgi:hypothetical protein